MKRVVLYNCATIFTSIWVKFPQVVFIWGAVIRALQACVSYDNCPVKVGPPLVYFNCTHCSGNLGETSRPSSPAHGRRGLSQRPGGKQERDDPTAILSKKLRAAEPPVHRSVNAGYEGEFVFPLPNSIRGARDDRCWWEAFGEGRGVVREGGSKQLLSQAQAKEAS